MPVIANIHSISPVASLIAQKHSSDGGSTLILIALAALAAIWVISRLGSAGATVVVVERPVGSFLGFALIILALGILYFTIVAPGSGPI